MFDDSFKTRYTAIPYALYRLQNSTTDYALAPHHHREFEFIAMVKGEADFYIDATLYRIREGDILVIPPYCVHRANIPEKTEYDCICFDLSLIRDEKLKSDLEDGILTVDGFLSANEEDTKTLHGHIRSTLCAYDEKENGWELEIVGRLSLVFSFLKRKNFFVKSSPLAKDEKFCREVFEYISQNYSDAITSTSLSQKLYMNNSYFCRLFKKNFQSNFSDFLNAYRIEKAKVLLKETDASISSILAECGFNSFSYFSKTFRAQVGLSPKEYRENHKKEK